MFFSLPQVVKGRVDLGQVLCSNLANKKLNKKILYVARIKALPQIFPTMCCFFFALKLYMECKLGLYYIESYMLYVIFHNSRTLEHVIMVDLVILPMTLICNS